MNHIAAAGNTVVPAILALEALGFRVEMSDGEHSRCEARTATTDGRSRSPCAATIAVTCRRFAATCTDPAPDARVARGCRPTIRLSGGSNTPEPPPNVPWNCRAVY